MTLLTTLSSLLLLSLSALRAQGAVTQDDFTGLGEIWVLNSADWRTGNPSQKVGCLTSTGRFLGTEEYQDSIVSNDDETDSERSKCGVFQKLSVYPYTISSREGNCTFNDKNTEANKDSAYGKRDHAWSCNGKYVAEVFDALYTIDGFPYPFLCFGDIACYYDVPHIPSSGKTAPLWQFRWGSEQRGITPGHVMVQLMWHRVGAPKREGRPAPVPGPIIELEDDILLRGQQMRE
ncbi:uncharacterized protein EI97DRAFT_125261 [Westerdykella ornata]|uniref:Ecp2 effector protein domain-containing protein n=1 Tax=Westerdykella ornata TaxID=318751 RepID=A0A6A6JVC5_WESOR|nr:uncharacterized protein EI97DRAFT_125261 [Westerdykella ornata]KAF2280542.1 hypothetical protein EI97DRAFT_125261 [Westerdykella ornata]